MTSVVPMWIARTGRASAPEAGRHSLPGVSGVRASAQSSYGGLARLGIRPGRRHDSQPRPSQNADPHRCLASFQLDLSARICMLKTYLLVCLVFFQ